MKKKKDDPLLTALTGREQRALVEQPDTRYPIEYRNLVYLRLHLDTGLRLSEMLHLRWGQVHPSDGKLFVRGDEVQSRVLRVHERVRKQLRAWRERQAREWKKRRTQEEAPDELPDYVFTNLNGCRITDRYVRKMVQLHARDAGIRKKVTPAVLRHTFATNLYLETGNLPLVQKALGHEDLSSTRVYTEVAKERLKDVLNNVQRAAIRSPGMKQNFRSIPVLSGECCASGRKLDATDTDPDTRSESDRWVPDRD